MFLLRGFTSLCSGEHPQPRHSFWQCSRVIFAVPFGFAWEEPDGLGPERPVYTGGVSSYPSREGEGEGAAQLEGVREKRCPRMVLARCCI